MASKQIVSSGLFAASELRLVHLRTATIHSRFPERNPQPRKRVIRPKTTTGWLKARQAVKALDASVKEIQSEQTASTPAIQRRSADYFDAIRGRIKYPLSDANGFLSAFGAVVALGILGGTALSAALLK